MTAKKCATKFCKNKTTKGNFCSTCRARKFREKNPMRACYITLKANAKRRGKEFTISFDFFKRFCRRTNYMAGKGRERESFTIDRKDPRKGYVPGNIRVLPKWQNSSKGKMLLYDWRLKQASVVEVFVNKTENIF